MKYLLLLSIIIFSTVNIGVVSTETSSQPQLGFDVSSFNLVNGSTTFYVDGNKVNPLEYLANSYSVARLRLWNNPVDGIYGLNYTLNLASQQASKGYKIMTLFVYTNLHVLSSLTRCHHHSRSGLDCCIAAIGMSNSSLSWVAVLSDRSSNQ